MVTVSLSSVVRSNVRQQLPVVDLFTEDIVDLVVDWDDSTRGLVFSMSDPSGFLSYGMLECCATYKNKLHVSQKWINN